MDEEESNIRVLKIKLEKIILDTSNTVFLNEILTKANEITIHCMNFIRLYILKLYDDNKEIPKIDADFVRKVFECLKIKKSKSVKDKTDEELENFFDIYSQYGGEHIKAKYLTQILLYTATTIVTNFETNIRVHFIKHVKRYVNGCFKDEINKQLEHLKGNTRYNKKKELYKKLSELKEDLINHTNECKKEKYCNWLEENRYKILPKEFKVSYYYDVNKYPQKYVKYMIYMNIELEKQNKKMFQFCPLRTNTVQKFFPIDTFTMNSLFFHNKTYQSDLTKYKNEIWSQVFNLNHKIFKSKKYEFDYRILTDGYVANLQFVLKSKLEKISKTKADKITAKKKAIEDKKTSPEEYDKKIKERTDKNNKRIEEREKLASKRKEIKDDAKNLKKVKNDIKNLLSIKKQYLEIDVYDEKIGNPLRELEERKKELEKNIVVDENKIEKDDIKTKIINIKKKINLLLLNKKDNMEIDIYEKEIGEPLQILENEKLILEQFIENKKREKIEKSEKEKKETTRKKHLIEDCLYLEDLNDIEYENLKKKNIVVCDPGKKNLLYMRFLDKDKKERFLRYTNGEKLFKTRRIKYMKKLTKYRKEVKITEIEKELTNLSSNTCDYKKFGEYLKKKNEINKKLFKKYDKIIFRQYKWYSFINKQRSEENMIKKMKKEFKEHGIDENMQIVYGDWSQTTQMKNFISTPNKGIKRLVKKHFDVYNINEFRTSKLNHKTKKDCKNLKIKDKKKRIRELHSVLTYKMENGRLGCIQRDKNATRNMAYIVEYYLQHRERPEEFKKTKNALPPLTAS